MKRYSGLTDGESKATCAGASLAADDRRVPLVIGVTGHRDLRAEDREELESRVHAILARIRRRYPNTALILLSSLAEGADRLAARVALSPDISAQLVAPLPMPRQLYEEDFAENGSLEEFRVLLAMATKWFELPPAAGTSPESLRASDECRNRQYEAVGKYIAGNSQILIALWDGVDTGLTGGTSAIIRFKRDGLQQPEHGSSLFSSLDPAESGPVYHILTPRLKNPEPVGEPFRLRKYFPEVAAADDVRAERYYERMFACIDAFNFEVSNAGPKLTAEMLKSKRSLVSEPHQKKISVSARRVLDRFAACDALAVSYQMRAAAVQWRLHLLIGLSFLSFALFAHLGVHQPIFLFASMMVLAAALWTHSWVNNKKRDFQNKHQDFRALTEGLRVQLFWLLAGVNHSVAWHYLGKQRTELDWIRNALRAWDITREDLGSSQDGPSDPEHTLAMDFVRRHWLEDQHHFFSTRVDRERKRLERGERASKAAVALGIGLAAVLLLVLLAKWAGKPAGLDYMSWLGDQWVEYAIISIEMCLVVAALIHNFSGKMAYSEHAKQYSRMKSLFGHAQERFITALERRDISGARDLLTELGKEALAENGDWLLLHRERPLEVPHA